LLKEFRWFSAFLFSLLKTKEHSTPLKIQKQLLPIRTFQTKNTPKKYIN
jgi:hypothetical protein